MRVKKNIDEEMKKCSSNSDICLTTTDSRRQSVKDQRSQLSQHPELAQLSHLTSSFHRERATFRHAFSFDTEGSHQEFLSSFEK